MLNRTVSRVVVEMRPNGVADYGNKPLERLTGGWVFLGESCDDSPTENLHASMFPVLGTIVKGPMRGQARKPSQAGGLRHGSPITVSQKMTCFCCRSRRSWLRVSHRRVLAHDSAEPRRAMIPGGRTQSQVHDKPRLPRRLPSARRCL